MKTLAPKSSVGNSAARLGRASRPGRAARLGRWVAPVAVAMLSGAAFAQYSQPVYVPSPQTAQPAQPAYVPSQTYRLDEEQLDNLTGPIALYPDPLIAEILPAATYPNEVQSAGQWVRANGTPAQELIDAQPWEPPVRALVHYPTVLEMMADRIDWTQQLGSAYLNQPDDVMNSIQRLRSLAQSDGALVTTPEQQVIVQDNLISIVPANPDVIFVPEYDPVIVFVRNRHVDRDAIRFHDRFRAGPWLNNDTDWRRHFVVEGTRWDHRNRPEVREGRNVNVQPEGRRWERNNSKPLPAPMAGRRPESGRPDAGRPEAGRDEHRPPAARDEHAQPAAQSERPENPRFPERRGEPQPRSVEPQPRAIEPARPEARPEPGREARPEARPEPARPEPARVESPRAEPARPGPARAESPRVEPARPEPARVEPSRAEPAHAEPAHAEPARVEERHEEPAARPASPHADGARAAEDGHAADGHDGGSDRKR
jgi:hypothetical protein